MLLHHDLAVRVGTALINAQKKGDLPEFEIPEILVERPRDPTHGSYASAIALQSARLARMAPLKIAEIIANHLEKPEYLSEVTVSPPGFINFILSTEWLQEEVNRILASGFEYGRFDLGNGKKAQVECVSANPTGPITLGQNARRRHGRYTGPGIRSSGI